MRLKDISSYINDDTRRTSKKQFAFAFPIFSVNRLLVVK